jgi:hypothetical protein
MEVSGQIQAPLALPPGIERRYPLSRGTGGPKAGPDVLEERKLLPLPGFEPRIIRPVA